MTQPPLPYSHRPDRRRSNGPGIAALIIGVITLMISWVPFCGSIPGIGLALIGLGLGIAGWVWAARDRSVNMGLAVVGTALCALAIVVGGVSMLVVGRGIGQAMEQAVESAEKASAAMQARRTQFEASPAPFEGAGVYFVSGNGDLAGTGFVLDALGTRYAVAAMHPYDNNKPDSFLLIEKDTDLKLGERVYTGLDVQVMRIPQDAPVVGISYPGPMPLRSGDRLAVLTDDGPRTGVLTDAALSATTKLPAEMKMDQPLKAQGLSGSPVILLSTGTVVGVLLSADSPDTATTVSFEPLQMDVPPAPAK